MFVDVSYQEHKKGFARCPCCIMEWMDLEVIQQYALKKILSTENANQLTVKGFEKTPTNARISVVFKLFQLEPLGAVEQNLLHFGI
jgi:hypothetical protein